MPIFFRGTSRLLDIPFIKHPSPPTYKNKKNYFPIYHKTKSNARGVLNGAWHWKYFWEVTECGQGYGELKSRHYAKRAAVSNSSCHSGMWALCCHNL